MTRLLLNPFIILLLLPIHLFAQTATPATADITGVWKGSLYNDTSKKTLPYEIAISDEKGKLYGYSYTLFDIDGKKELGVKQVKIKRKDDLLIIEDVELISNNYSAPPPKKVRQLSIVKILVGDTAMQLTGKWSTNPTKEYSPLTGTITMQRAIDFKAMVLYKILAELKLDKDLSFVKAANKKIADMAVTSKAAIGNSSSPTAGSYVTDADKPVIIVVGPADKAVPGATTAPRDTSGKAAALPVVKPIPAVEIVEAVPMQKTTVLPTAEYQIKIAKKPAAPPIVKVSGRHIPANIVYPKALPVIVAVNNEDKVNDKPVTARPVPLAAPPPTKKTQQVAIVNEPAKPVTDAVKKQLVVEKPKAVSAPVVEAKTPVAAAIKLPPALIAQKDLPVVPAPATGTAAAANVAERKMNNQQSVFFESDSLVLTLYDNGDVDGDTVSVLMNGQIIFAKQGLSTKANSKTIYIDKAMPDTLSMIMYAENLGSIPPNTGLLIIMDGEKRYEVRFSADLKTNAAILLRRRKPENK